jgi:hypothetical protein
MTRRSPENMFIMKSSGASCLLWLNVISRPPSAEPQRHGSDEGDLPRHDVHQRTCLSRSRRAGRVFVVDRTSAVLLSRNHDGTEAAKVNHNDTTFTKRTCLSSSRRALRVFVVDRTSAVVLSRNHNGTEATKVNYNDTTFTSNMFIEQSSGLSCLVVERNQPSCFRGTTTARKRRR